VTPQSDEDEVWRQIVASFNEPTEVSPADQPWPDSENLTPRQEERRERRDEPGAAADVADVVDVVDVAERPAGGGRDHAEPDVLAEDPDDEHYVPPPPPPLPKLDLGTKLAWFALFGGPAYLLLAAVLDWPMDGWILFAAVAAFIGGFVALVVRMGDGPPKDSGWDDGAVV
jgi:hypothetical protein